MKVAVVGGGIFGCTAAIYAARAGHDVSLFEQSDGIMSGASGSNQFRLHRGYHYPRSPETIEECQVGLKSFEREYGGAIETDGEHYYAIAKEGSLTTPEAFIERCGDEGLPIGKCAKPMWMSGVSDVFRVMENRLNPGKMLLLMDAKLRQAGVQCYFDHAIQEDLREDFDQIIVAAYAGTNSVLETLGCETEEYQFELCEKPVIKLAIPPNDGAVVLDGPFCSIDPLGTTGLHLMGHVEYAIWQTSFGTTPEIPQAFKPYVNRGVIPNPIETLWPEMQAAGSEFFPDLENARHIGSHFVVRTVLKGKEDTDARPTIVSRVDEQVMRVFSGKIPCAVGAAETIVSLLSASHYRRDEKEELAA